MLTWHFWKLIAEGYAWVAGTTTLVYIVINWRGNTVKYRARLRSDPS